MSVVRERLRRAIEELPDELLEEVAEALDDVLALAQAKSEDDGTRVDWATLRRELLDQHQRDG